MQQINVIVTPKAKQTISVTINGVAMSVVNSDGSYSTTHYSGTPFIIPDITVTDSDGSTYSLPSVKDVVCTPPVGADVENSDGSYTQHVNNGATLVLPDTIIKNTEGATILTQPSATSTGVITDSVITNSDASFSLNVPAETNPVLANITHIDSDGTPVVYPSAKAFTCTPTPPAVVGEQFYILFPAFYKSFIDIDIDATSAGTYVDDQKTNIDSIIYTVNDTPVSFPFAVADGDVLGITIVKTSKEEMAVLELTNASISPYTFSADGFTSVYPPAHNDTYVKATSSYDATNYLPHFATDPSKSLIGSQVGTSWISGSGQPTNQRFHIDLGSSQTIGRLYYENIHNSGDGIQFGVRQFTLWGSDSASDFADLTYANDGTWTQITGLSSSAFISHIYQSVSDPHFVVFPPATYRYWCLKIANGYSPNPYLGVRRIELQQ